MKIVAHKFGETIKRGMHVIEHIADPFSGLPMKESAYEPEHTSIMRDIHTAKRVGEDGIGAVFATHNGSAPRNSSAQVLADLL